MPASRVICWALIRRVNSPGRRFLGALFEGFIAAEIAKAQVNAGGRRELYYFRDEQGLEVDFLVPGRGGAVALVECKAGRTVTPAMAAPMQRLAEALKRKRAKGCRHEDVPRPSGTAGGNTDRGCRSRRAGAAVAGISRQSVTAKQA